MSCMYISASCCYCMYVGTKTTQGYTSMTLNKPYQLRFNDGELKKAKEYAEKNGRTVSDVIRAALAEYIKQGK